MKRKRKKWHSARAVVEEQGNLEVAEAEDFSADAGNVQDSEDLDAFGGSAEERISFVQKRAASKLQKTSVNSSASLENASTRMRTSKPFKPRTRC